MQYYLIIPAHNEAQHIALTLQSIEAQTVLPKKIVIVNDHSTDETESIVKSFLTHNPNLILVNNLSDSEHQPGSKVIRAFQKGLETLGDYLGSTSITEGKDGNFSGFQMSMSRVGKIIQEFKILEKEYNAEVASSIRGCHEAGYDE